MSDVFLAEVPEFEVFSRIKGELSPLSYAECMNCGAVKVDATEAVRALDALADRDYGETDDYGDYLKEVAWDLLWSIVEDEPDFFSEDDPCWYDHWVQWKKQNWERRYGWLRGYYECGPVYLNCQEVLFFYDRECDCFREAKDSAP